MECVTHGSHQSAVISEMGSEKVTVPLGSFLTNHGIPLPVNDSGLKCNRLSLSEKHREGQSKEGRGNSKPCSLPLSAFFSALCLYNPQNVPFNYLNDSQICSLVRTNCPEKVSFPFSAFVLFN